MIRESLFKAFIYLLLIGSFANAVKIRIKQFNCNLEINCEFCLKWRRVWTPYKDGSPMFNEPVRNDYCDYKFESDPSTLQWDILPVSPSVPNGNVYICAKGTNFCLGVDYNEKHRALQVYVLEKNDAKHGLRLQWNYDGKKITNGVFGPNNCVTKNLFIDLMPCTPDSPYQRWEIA